MAKCGRFLAGNLLFSSRSKQFAYAWLNTEDSLVAICCLVQKVNSAQLDSGDSMPEVCYSAQKVSSKQDLDNSLHGLCCSYKK